jgi:hypothetical protein
MFNHVHETKFNKKNEIHDFMERTNFCSSTVPISPWAKFATWQHVGALLENTEFFYE